MEQLKTFDLQAMVNPKGAEGVLVLMREFRAELACLQEHMDCVAEECEAAAAAV
jgi:hypothetical protein